MTEFAGVYPAMVTPLTKELEIDENGLRHEVDFLIERNVHGLVVLGSSGEFPYITVEDKKKVIDIVVEHADRRVPVIVGTSSIATDEVVQLSKYARAKSADGLIINLPVYYNLTDDDVFNHYATVAQAVDLPIMLYDFPELTHLDMSPELIVRLSYIENVVGIKETASLEKIEKVLKIKKKESFRVFTGISFILLDALKLGCAGVICMIPCIAPREVVAIYESFKEGNIDKAAQQQGSILSLISIVAVPVQTPLVKETMRQLGVNIQPFVKNPLPQITDSQKEIVRKTLTDLGLIKDQV